MKIERNVFIGRDEIKTPISYVRLTNAIPIVFHFRDYTIPEGAETRVYSQKPSGKAVYGKGAIEGNSVNVDITKQMFAELGRTYLQVQIISGEDELVTFAQPVDVKPNYTQGDAPESQNEDGFFGEIKESISQLSKEIDALKENGTGTGGATTEQIEQIEKNKKDISQIQQTNSALSGRVQTLEEASGITVIEPSTKDIPKIFFDEAIPQTKDDVVTKFRYISETLDFEGYAEFKAQGNSSMGYPKKNMTVKMYTDETLEEKLKVDFKGWGKQNKHVYKANWIDLSHARNVVSARIWADVVKSRANYLSLPELLRTSPNQGAVDGFPVKVYSQGIYQGRYTLNIPKDAWMANMDDELDEHCILCSENYYSGCFRASANINGGDWTDEIHDTVPTSIKTRWNEVISFVMNSTDEEFKANLGNYFYVDSLIDYLIYGMVSCGLDAFGKNQLYFTYDGLKWVAEMYDMDSTWGLYWNGSKFVSASYSREQFEDFVSTSGNGQGNLLYIRLVNLFANDIKTRWNELKQNVLSIPNIINHFERFTDIAHLDLVKEDYASTTGNGKFTGIPSQSTNNIQQIRQFIIDRYAYCDEYFASLEENGGEVEPDNPEATLTSISATYTGGNVTVGTNVDSLTGIKVTANYSDGTSSTVIGYTLSGTIVEGSNTITVTYNGVTTTFTVIGVEEEIEVTLTSINANYAGGDVEVGTQLTALTGITVTGTYSDGTISEITGYSLIGEIIEGSNVITVIYENKTTTFIVNGVISYVAPTDYVYSLPQETTFNGTSDFVDTGYKLFDTNKDFAIIFDFTNGIGNPQNTLMLHSIYEVSPYNGLQIWFGGKLEIVINKTFIALGTAPNNDSRYKVVISKNAETNTITVKTSSGVDETVEATMIFDQTVLLGAYQTTSGTKGRYWKGTIHECKIYDRQLTEDEMTEFIS